MAANDGNGQDAFREFRNHYSQGTSHNIIELYEKETRAGRTVFPQDMINVIANAYSSVRQKDMANEIFNKLSNDRKAFLQTTERQHRTRGRINQANQISTEIGRIQEDINAWNAISEAYSNNSFRQVFQGADESYLNQIDFSQKIRGVYQDPFARSQETFLGIFGESRKRPFQNRPPVGLEVLDSLNGAPMADAGGIWKYVNSPLHSGVSTFGVQTQKYLEQFMGFSDSMKQGQDFIAFDTETWGNWQNGEWYHMSELSAQGFSYDGSKHVVNEALSFNALIKPADAMRDTLRQQIELLKRNPAAFTMLNADQKRTMVDLMRYSNADVAIGGMKARAAGFGDQVTQSNVLDLNNLYIKRNGKTILNEAVAMSHMSSYAAHMESGLANMIDKGMEQAQAITEFNNFVAQNDALNWVSHNGHAFDEGALKAAGMNVPSQHIDLYKTLQSVFNDPNVMHQVLAQNLDNARVYENGAFTLEELRATLFGHLDEYNQLKDSAHTASFDVGTYGVGGVMSEIHERIAKQIDHAKLDEAPADYRAAQMKLAFSTDELKPGDILFSNSGYNNWGGTEDFQAVMDENGRYLTDSSSYNSTVVHAETFYEYQGIRDLTQDGGPTRLALQIKELEGDTTSFIIREGDDARYQLAEFVQKQLPAWDPKSGEGAIIGEERARDLARRRYEQMFSLNQGATRGYSALTRMMGNVATIHQELPNVSTSAELASVYESVKSKLNFNSLWSSEQGDFVHNKAEEQAFVHMFDRLNSEHSTLRTMMDVIEEAIPSTGRTEKELNRERSVAIGEALRQLENSPLSDGTLLGAHKETRLALPYENRLLPVDLREGKVNKAPITLSLESPDKLLNSIRSYMYADSKDLKAQQAGADVIQGRAMDRLHTLLTNVSESVEGVDGKPVLSPKDVQSIAREQITSGLSPDVASQQIAGLLWHGEYDFNPEIELSSMEARQAMTKVSEESAQAAARTALSSMSDIATSVELVGESGRRKARITGELDRLLTELDKLDTVTKLNPNNRVAIEGVLNAFLSYGTLGTSISVTDDRTQAVIRVFDRTRLDSVEQDLRSGKTPTGVLTVNMPLIGENGTMAYGDKQIINARSFLRLKEGEIVKESSAERLSNQVVSRVRGKTVGEAMMTGNWEKAQNLLNLTMREEMNELSGVRKSLNFSDKNFWQNTLGDAIKQGNVDMTDAMIRTLVVNGDLAGNTNGVSDLVTSGENSAYDWTGHRFKNYLSVDNLTMMGREKLMRHMQTWMNPEHNKTEQLHSAGVKGDLFVHGIASTIDPRDLTSYGHFTNQGRDNALQSLNTVILDGDVADTLNDLESQHGIYANTRDMLITDKMKDLQDSRLQDGQKVYTNAKVAYMDEITLHERVMAMAQTTEGKRLLVDENILSFTDDGGMVWDDVRFPTVHEQQAMMAQEFADAFTMTRTTKDGVTVTEQVHKWFVDIEKVTAGGGHAKFSGQFLEALTGVEGIGMIVNADVKKHEDFGSILRLHVNKVVDAIENADASEQSDLINKANELGNKVGFFAEQTPDGPAFRYRPTQDLLAELNPSNPNLAANQAALREDFENLLKGFGLQETALIESATYGLKDAETVWGIQGIGAAEISNWSTDKANNVNYSIRELDVLRRLGPAGQRLYDHISDGMLDVAAQNGDLNEFKGMVQAVSVLANGPQDDMEKLLFNLGDFRDMPAVDNNAASHAGTILDHTYIDEMLEKRGVKDATGIYLQMPETLRGFDLKAGGRKVEQVFLPIIRNEPTGNDLFKDQVQRLNADVYTRARAVEQAKVAQGGQVDLKQVNTATNNLNQTLDHFGSRLSYELTSSKGSAIQNVLRQEMPNSSSGLMKIIAPERSQAQKGAITYINEATATKMGIFDQLKAAEEAGEKYFAANLRYPTFHTDALQISELRLNEHVADGEHHIDSLIASLMRGDSDGDYNNLVAFTSQDPEEAKKLQSALRQLHADQTKEDMQRMGQYDRAWDNYLDQAYEELHQHHVGSDLERRDWKLSAMDVKVSVPNTAGEITAKSGKMYVGMASDINSRLRQLSDQFVGDKEQQIMIENFGASLEQKIISAKHLKDAKIDIKNSAPAYQMITALQGALNAGTAEKADEFWNEALDIEKQHFTDDGKTTFKNLAETREIMRNVQYKHPSMAIGLSGGMRIADWANEGRANPAILHNVLQGLDSNATYSNTAMNLIMKMIDDNANVETIQTFAKMAQDPAPRPLPSGGGARLGHLAEVAETAAEAADEPHGLMQRGMSSIGDFMEARGGRKSWMLGAGAAAGAGLALIGMTRADGLHQGDSGHDNEEMQQAHGDDGGGASPYMPQQTAHVEQNGTGYNGMTVQVSGKSAGSLDGNQVGNLTGQALQQAGIQAQINTRLQDDRSTVDKSWLENEFRSLIEG